jgi:hypothetical protein
MPAATIKATTQQHLDIEDIVDDIIILGDGSGCLVLSATAINFDLLSEAEQEATIYAYAAIINSLTYPIQLVIHSQRKDITEYLNYIKQQEQHQTSKLLKNQIRKYHRFVEETVKTNNVLDKHFYVVIPFTALELGAPKAFTASITGKKGLPFSKSFILQQAKNHLLPKRDHLTRQFARLGIRLHQLSTPELIHLFYRIYNPDASTGQKLASTEDYAIPIVQGPLPITQNLNQKLESINQQPLPPLPSDSPPSTPQPDQPSPSQSTPPQVSQPIEASPKEEAQKEALAKAESLIKNTPPSKPPKEESPPPQENSPDTPI